MSDRGSELSHLQIPEIEKENIRNRFSYGPEILEHNGSIVVKPIEGTPNE